MLRQLLDRHRRAGDWAIEPGRGADEGCSLRQLRLLEAVAELN